MMGFLANIQNILIAVAVSLTIGFGGGFYTSKQFAKAAQIDVIVDQRKDDVLSVEATQKQEKTLQAGVSVSRDNNVAIRMEVRKHAVIAHTVVGDGLVPKNNSVCGDSGLTNLTVGLLNAAREDRPVTPALWGDGAGETSSGIEIPDLIDNDLEIVGLYHDLARRHDALVDWAESEVQKHNDRIKSNK